MIRNPEILRAFEDDWIRRSRPNHLENLRLAEAMLEEATALGVWPPSDPLEGIEIDIRVAEVLGVLVAA